MFDKKSIIVKRILNEISKNGEMSAYKLRKTLGYDESLIKYHLDKLVDLGVLVKSGSKYNFIKNIINVNGTLIVNSTGKVYVLWCPYIDECGCKVKSIDECRLINELPESMKKDLKKF